MKITQFDKVMIFRGINDTAFTIVGFKFAGMKINGQVFNLLADYQGFDDRPLYIKTDDKDILKIYRVCVLSSMLIQEVDRQSITREEFKSATHAEL